MNFTATSHAIMLSGMVQLKHGRNGIGSVAVQDIMGEGASYQSFQFLPTVVAVIRQASNICMILMCFDDCVYNSVFVPSCP